MTEQAKGALSAIISKHEGEILADWIREQSSLQTRKDPVQEAETRRADEGGE